MVQFAVIMIMGSRHDYAIIHVRSNSIMQSDTPNNINHDHFWKELVGLFNESENSLTSCNSRIALISMSHIVNGRSECAEIQGWLMDA